MVWYSKFLGTYFTNKWLLSWVSSQVGPEMSWLSKWFRTLLTTKRLLSWMSAHVFLDGISLCAWIVTLVSGQRKICIGINLWKVSANTELCTMRFTLQTKTKKGGERNPQRPYVCLLVHSNFSSKHSHSVSYRSKTIQLPVVWIQMHNKWWPQETHTDTFRREALHLHAVWVLLHNSSWPQKTHRPPLYTAHRVFSQGDLGSTHPNRNRHPHPLIYVWGIGF